MDPAKVTSRSNSELCNIAHILEQRHLSPEARVLLIWRIADDWHEDTRYGDGPGHPAQREVSRLNHIGERR
jgi:hypothetical protein